MASLNLNEIRRIEKQFTSGIKSGKVVEVFQAKGYRFSEATLRKYVQLGLLPKSRRVGVRGRHKGSSGLYPVSIVRLINEIKKALDSGATLEDIRFGYVALAGELDASRRTCTETLEHFQNAIKKCDDSKLRQALDKALNAQRRSLKSSFSELEKLAVRIGRGRK
ncbi:MAG: MerR family transcriptional regulator [Deltaproteobacteria bacterium]|nr:MerR family transcriptional regulator [Deltaproteobacteria bacterium]